MSGNIFYIDRVRIIKRDAQDSLIHALPVDDLKSFSQGFRIEHGSTTAKKHGYKSRIEITVPEKRLFEILEKHESALWNYKISYLEVVWDMPYPDEHKTVIDSERLFETIRKKYTHSHLVSDILKRGKSTSARKSKNNTEDTSRKYSWKTGYWGGKTYKLTIYPRLSKVINLPCIHFEWRIKGASNIEKKTGIQYISDLRDFHIESWFTEQFEKYIELSDIDHEKHGMFINNMKRGMKIRPGQFEPEVASRVFCRFEGIETAAGLKQFYKKTQEEIKHGRGRRTPWETKVMGLSWHKLNSFFGIS